MTDKPPQITLALGWRTWRALGLTVAGRHQRSSRAARDRSILSTSEFPLSAARWAAIARDLPRSLSAPWFASMSAWLRAKVSSSSTAIRTSASLRRVSMSGRSISSRVKSRSPLALLTPLKGLVFKTIGRRTFYVLDPHAKLAVFLPLPWEDAA